MPKNKINPWHTRARELSAKLLPHTTSIANVDLLAEELEAAYDTGYGSGYREGAADNYGVPV